MDYEKKYLIGNYVKGKRTFNGEVIEGKFNGFRLCNKLNPKSVVGVIDTDERCYDVLADSIELVESEDKKWRNWLIGHLKGYISQTDNKYAEECKKAISWLENQGEKTVEQDTEIHDLWVYIREWNEKFGRLPKDEDELAACIDYVMKRQKPADKIEQNLSWSEGDEHVINHLLAICAGAKRYRQFAGCLQEDITKYQTWLKSLKSQKHWKPSEEQLEALWNIIPNAANSDKDVIIIAELTSLYENLKQL